MRLRVINNHLMTFITFITVPLVGGVPRAARLLIAPWMTTNARRCESNGTLHRTTSFASLNDS